MLVVAGISTGHKIGLIVVAVTFIGFALVSSFVVPRRRPDYPGRAGMSVFVIASLALFAAMIAAVEIFGAESEARASSEPSAAPPAALQGSFTVKETEFHIALPPAAQGTLKPGRYAFAATDDGKLQHDLAIDGPNVRDKTSLLSPGGKATLTVSLGPGTYTLYCTVPGHRAAGMVTKITVG